MPFTGSTIATTVASKAWRESELQAMIGIQGWSGTSLREGDRRTRRRAAPPVAPEAGAFAFGAKLGFFGNNAPKWGILPPDTDNTHGDPYPSGWDAGDEVASGGQLGAPRTIWQDSQGDVDRRRDAYLERAVPNVTRTSWVGVRRAGQRPHRPTRVLDARETSRADFGISGRAMQLRLADASGEPLPDERRPTSFRFRSTAPHMSRAGGSVSPSCRSRRRSQPATQQIELDRMVLGLAAGQPVALVGERADLPGVDAAEIAVLADIVHADGRSTLVLRAGRSSTRTCAAACAISANVVHATHGETVNEVLGNGDASVAEPALHAEEAADDASVGDRRRDAARSKCASPACCGTSCRRSTAPRRTSRSTRRASTTTRA